MYVWVLEGEKNPTNPQNPLRPSQTSVCELLHNLNPVTERGKKRLMAPDSNLNPAVTSLQVDTRGFLHYHLGKH